MHSIDTKAIVIGSIDYKEKDKLVQLVSLEYGKIFAVIKGVRTDKAKLKFACQPFCFADFSFIKTGDKFQITSATLIDSFYDLTKDYDDYTNCLKMLDIVKETFVEEQTSTTVFVKLIKSLSEICYNKINSKIILIKFILSVLNDIGYGLKFNKCSVCGCDFERKKYINYSSGELVCMKCFEVGNKEIDSGIFSALKMINSTELERLNTIKISNNILDNAIKIISTNLNYRTTKSN